MKRILYVAIASLVGYKILKDTMKQAVVVAINNHYNHVKL
jgi:hypothetical protein